MFNTSFSVDFPTGNAQSGILYSRLETAVIASFDPVGKIKPLYFEYKDLYGDDNSIRIESILSSKEEHYAGLPVIIYTCIAIIENKKLQCRLRYHISEHYWELLY